jgi:hypothetical protein
LVAFLVVHIETTSTVYPESGVKTPVSEYERFQPVKLCEYVSGQVS